MIQHPVNIQINSKKVLLVLGAVVTSLVGLSIWGQYIKYVGVVDIRGYWHEFILDLLMSTFYLDAEGNIPTFTNALLLFVPALLLGFISAGKTALKDKYRFHWLLLSLIFLALAFDEAAVLHEKLIKPMRNVTEAGGVFHFAWVIPGMIALAFFGVAFLQFFLHLDKKFKWLFFVSFGVYVAGVIGGEMISGYYAANLGMKNFTYATVASLEESIEMFGCSLIIYSLLEYLKSKFSEGLMVKSI